MDSNVVDFHGLYTFWIFPGPSLGIPTLRNEKHKKNFKPYRISVWSVFLDKWLPVLCRIKRTISWVRKHWFSEIFIFAKGLEVNLMFEFQKQVQSVDQIGIDHVVCMYTVQRSSVQTKLVLCTKWPICTMLFYYGKMPESSSP